MIWHRIDDLHIKLSESHLQGTVEQGFALLPAKIARSVETLT
jgi:hypothetical protein